MSIKNLLLCVLLQLGISAIVTANEQPVTPSAQQQWEQLVANAEAGHVGAQYVLAQYYFHASKKTPAYAALAQQWYSRAAEQNHVRAALRAGEMAHYGDGVPRDFVLAVKWYQRAAELGSDDAMDYLGLFYMRGLGGLPKDCQLAYDWFDRAFKAGYQVSLNNLMFNLATSDNDQCRDGQRALVYAEMALQLLPEMDASWLDTVAAVYAENGLFDKAVEYQRSALKALNAETEINHDRVAKFNARLQLYLNKKTWRGTSAPNAEDYGEPLLKTP
jgi:tetratricopeptide (TPR) repeat protein